MRVAALLGVLVLVAIALATVWWRRRRRAVSRERLRAQPFPPAWRRLLERNMPLYGRLSAPERERLEGHIQVFLVEKRFEGCGGLEMTDEVRVTVAAQACLLLLEHDIGCYSDLRSILVYPTTVVPEYAHMPQHGGIVHEPAPVLGESWGHGAVILAWDDVQRGAATIDDGRNVVFHEFAHQLDQEAGEADGTPHLDNISAFRTWGRVMREHFVRLREATEEGRPTLLDPYGATNPAEFFAVATEYFFERPLALRREHPELYRELSSYYRVDPVSWLEPG